jgi:hypothetical protein
VTFEEIDKLFGRDSNFTELQKREFFEDYKFQRVQWTGEIMSVRESLGGKLHVRFKHKQKTGVYDITVSFPNTAKDTLLKLKEGQTATYREAFCLLVSVCFFNSCVWLKKYFPQFGFDWTLLALMGMYEIRD